MIERLDIFHSVTNKMVLLLLLSGIMCANLCAQEADYAQYIDPMIGTQGTGNTFPGASRPWGMVNLAPHTNFGTVSGFYARASRIYGFVHTNVSGPGCTGLGNLLLMATRGPVLTKKIEFSSRYAAADSESRAGYFSTRLHSYAIDAEIASTKRVGISRFTFEEQAGDANILMHVTGGLTRTENAYVEVRDDSTLVGFKTGGIFCGYETSETIYFYARFSKAVSSAGVFKDGEVQPAEVLSAEGRDVGGFMRFNTQAGEQILVKVGISYVSINNAQLNLEAELPDWDFDGVADAAYDEWNATVSRIQVEDDNVENKTIFYTGMYHTLLHPNVFNDVNGEYPDRKNGIVKTAENYTRYTLYSLWDTYRTVHPFLTLMYPEQQNDMLQSMLEHYKETASLPLWEIVGTDTYVMNGDPANIVICDSYSRGLRGFDVDLAYEAVKRHSFVNDNGFPSRPENRTFSERGFIPYSDEWLFYTDASVSLLLEYCLADAGAANMAASFCRPQDVKRLKQRSRFFLQNFDHTTKFFRPRLPSGEWLTPFDPDADTHVFEDGYKHMGGAGFTEGTAWNYRFFVPHAQAELIELFGGPDAYSQVLQQYFTEGHYWWNQHNLAYPFLFNYVAGEQWRSVEQSRTLMSSAFSTAWNGIPQNDDAGCLSTWYMYAALGFYPDNPGSPTYLVTGPLFNKVTLHLDERYYPGKSFVITAKPSAQGDKFVERVLLNGQEFTSGMIDHSAIVAGGTFDFDLRTEPADVLNMPPTTELEATEDLAFYDPKAFELRITNPVDAETLELQFAADGAFCSILSQHEIVNPRSIELFNDLPDSTVVHARARYIRHGASGKWSNTFEFKTLPKFETSVLDSQNANALSIVNYGPNPANNLFSLTLYSPRPARLTIQVFNTVGQSVLRDELSIAGHAPSPHALDFSSLPTGVYVIEVSDGSTRTSVLTTVMP